MAEPQGTPSKRSQESPGLAKEALTLIAEGRMPSMEEIERAAKASMAKVRQEHPELFKDSDEEVEASDQTASEWLHVDRTEFATRLGMIAKLKGLGREPVTLRFNGMELILTYVCVIRIPASGRWPAEARLSKAAVKRFIKAYVEPRLVKLAGEKRATVHRFVRGVTARAHELVIERRGDQMIVDGTSLKCTWSAPPV